MKLILKGQPLSTQHAYGQRGKLRFMKSEARELKESYIRQLKEQNPEYLGNKPVGMVVRLFHKDMRVRDIDNYNKMLLDSLKGIIINDDRQINELYIKKYVDKENPRIELEIYKL